MVVNEATSAVQMFVNTDKASKTKLFTLDDHIHQLGSYKVFTEDHVQNQHGEETLLLLHNGTVLLHLHGLSHSEVEEQVHVFTNNTGTVELKDEDKVEPQEHHNIEDQVVHTQHQVCRQFQFGSGKIVISPIPYTSTSILSRWDMVWVIEEHMKFMPSTTTVATQAVLVNFHETSSTGPVPLHGGGLPIHGAVQQGWLQHVGGCLDPAHQHQGPPQSRELAIANMGLLDREEVKGDPLHDDGGDNLLPGAELHHQAGEAGQDHAHLLPGHTKGGTGDHHQGREAGQRHVHQLQSQNRCGVPDSSSSFQASQFSYLKSINILDNYPEDGSEVAVEKALLTNTGGDMVAFSVIVLTRTTPSWDMDIFPTGFSTYMRSRSLRGRHRLGNVILSISTSNMSRGQGHGIDLDVCQKGQQQEAQRVLHHEVWGAVTPAFSLLRNENMETQTGRFTFVSENEINTYYF